MKHTVHISNHSARSTFIALSEALKGGFIKEFGATNIYYIYIIIGPIIIPPGGCGF